MRLRLKPLSFDEAISYCRWRLVRSYLAMRENELFWYCYKCSERHTCERRNEKLWNNAPYVEYTICYCGTYFKTIEYDRVLTVA